MRVGWTAFLGLILSLMAWSLPFADLNLRFNQFISDSYNLFGERIGLSEFLRLPVAVQYMISLLFIGIGCIIFLRKPDDRIALLTSLGLVCIPYLAYFSGLVYEVRPGGSAGKLLILAEGVASGIAIPAVLQLLLTFPDGKIKPAWISLLSRYFLFPMVLVGIVFSGILDNLPAIPIGPALLNELTWVLLGLGSGVLVILGGFSQIYKYARISSRTQRQQTKWVMFSLVVAFSWIIFNGLDPGRTLPYQLRGYYGLGVVIINLLVFGLIPVAFAVSLFRYRLYDVDLIIRRTLQYGMLTGLLAGLYFLVIVLMQSGLGQYIGQDNSPVVIVISTLSIAALFNPLRIRIQAFIDRRFFRSKYDSERTLAEFSASISSQVDLEQLTASIIGVVQKTLQPDAVSLWLTTEKPRKDGTKK